ncbi:Hypothetical protein R9X50_00313300 [Acrodontium crateriforme]|uniref:Uncharacterized protein n=1 Tax=Acrodontium crateriforme TaxID=150365 RepID=A0AAQ3M561_9PEZI|nr:Hypothetical protein R9X50_00313300 [Acrodontium crateriforme]
MSMLLTLSQPPRTDFGTGTHDFYPRLPFPKPPRLSPPTPRVDASVTSLPVSPPDKIMTTAHRGLPPPSAMTASMTLPDPGRPPPLTQSLGPMPAPPNQWQGQEESMRNWLLAKTEEDKRKQEEEKTQQESLKLEQRRIEQSMLRESLSAGIPPTMIPLIYASIAGANLANIGVDWMQQYQVQLRESAAQHHPQTLSPELRREPHLLSQPIDAYTVASSTQTQTIPSQPPVGDKPVQPAPLQTTFPAYQSTNDRIAPTSMPRSAVHTQLPRLTTNDMYIHQQPVSSPGGSHQPQQSRMLQDQATSSSPSIYFHHWVPPNEGKSTQPQTPASKGEPHSARPGSHRSDTDWRDSPRKRKATGAHQPNPPPSAGPQFTSPSFSTVSSASARKNGGRRSGSIASASDSRPESRRDTDPRRSRPDFGQPSEEKARPSSSETPRDITFVDSKDNER